MFDSHHSTHSHHNRSLGGGVNPPLHYTIRRIALVLALMGWISALTLVVYSQAGPEPSQHPLTLEARVGYQRAIEEVYWRHRIWPTENPQAKPALYEVMPPSAIQAKVEDYLRKSQALEAYWQRPITGEQLQVEMDRMAKQPGIVQELWAALGNDPYVIAECLARPSLANRLIRNWYAHDERYHGELKRRAEADRRAYGTVSQMREMSGEYREVEWTNSLHSQLLSQSERVAVRPGETVTTVALSSDEWETKLRELAAPFSRGKEVALQPDVAAGLSRQAILGLGAIGKSPSREVDFLPVGQLSGLQEDDEQFYVTAVLDKGQTQVRVGMVEWKKQPFESWGRGAASPGQIEEPSYAYRLAAIGSQSGDCVDDTWQPTLIPAITARSGHTAVWTGSEMIVWGGSPGGGVTNTGGRYDPTTDTWSPTSTSNGPSARGGHTAVWTGSQMIVWGGGDPLTNTGGRYDPASDTWSPTSTSNALSRRNSHTAVWTGSQMIVWSGSDSIRPYTLNTGGRYCASATTVPDFSVSSPSTASVIAGQSSAYTLSITPLGGFSGTLSLSCSGAPQASSCSVPPSVTLDGTNAATATATITTTARSTVARRFSPPNVWPLRNPGLTWLVLLTIAILTRWGMRRSRAHVGFGVAIFLIVLSLIGRASGGHGGGGTPPGTYTITFRGAAAQMSHTGSATLTVN